ncbi:MAG: glycosyltransferase family 1 protein [Clostridia bacterium]
MNERPIRILQCVVKMDIGGAESFIMNLYRKIDKSKVQFDFLTSLPGMYDEEIKKLGGKIFRIEYYKKTGVFKYYLSLIKFFKETNYNIVHSHMDCMSAVVLLAAKKNNIPNRIAHSHSTNNSGNILYKMYKNIFKKLINKVSTVKLACSKESAEWLFQKEAKKAKVILNGIEIDNFLYREGFKKEIRLRYNIPFDSFVVGHVGRMETVKNHKYLIDIFNEYFKKNNNSFLLLVGDGSLRKELEEKVQSLNIAKNVIFAGNVFDTFKYYSSMDIFVFPSLYEGLPLTLIEAQANGLPCIISENITKEIILNENVLYSNNIKIIKNKRLNSNEKIQSFNINNVLKVIEDIYDIK